MRNPDAAQAPARGPPKAPPRQSAQDAAAAAAAAALGGSFRPAAKNPYHQRGGEDSKMADSSNAKDLSDKDRRTGWEDFAARIKNA